MNNQIMSPLAPEALQKFVAEKKIRSTVRGICACGHSMGRHYQSDDGTWSCSPTRMFCGCRTGRPVLVTDNLRLFLYSTTGSGIDHALGKGILACIEQGVDFRWVDGHVFCDICKQETGEPIPVSLDVLGVDEDGRPITRPVNRTSRIDSIVCPSCYSEQWLR